MATERYFKLKGALVMPLRSGRRHRGRSIGSLEKRLWSWIEGRHVEVWEATLKVERQRTIKVRKSITKKRATNEGNKPWSERDMERRYRRAKSFANDGEYSKAFSAVVNRGKAPLNDRVLEELRSMNPPRINQVQWPTREEIKEERERTRNTLKKFGLPKNSVDVDNCTPDTFEDELQAIEISADDIVSAAKSARRNTTGGLQQIIPWFLRIAVLHSPGNRCAKVMATLANRWARGDFDSTFGKLWAMGRLNPLFKNNHDERVRPICVGSSLRRLLTKAYNVHLKARLETITESHQLGTKRAGYEIGVHAARAIAKRCLENGWAILIIDIENAFNTADRNLILRLLAAHIPEAAKLFWWFYHLETTLITSNGDEVLNSAGVQQGCPMATFAFALIIKWMVEQLNHKGLAHKMFFHDDGCLAGTPKSLGWAAKFIDEMSLVSGLKMKEQNRVPRSSPGVALANQCR